jgi:hypothetical protein
MFDKFPIWMQINWLFHWDSADIVANNHHLIGMGEGEEDGKGQVDTTSYCSLALIVCLRMLNDISLQYVYISFSRVRSW